ncbi:MAG: YbhB/YbcL family Raf kinase inhibitor-like protein [Labilithrix sp.]|nr:YbhB/YbcL family Raf kinase inhibitor-like protein [Labilithrix sp.]MCW5812444.1 YbhB/YbcL family Raf kinase inhibitor-like protein [Labilithrix sp.]
MRIALLALVVVTACGKPQLVPRAAPGVVVASITVTSPSFTEGGRIPVDCTCDGKEVMPELVISSPPEGTKSLVVTVDDPDASSGVFVHMVAFNLSPDLRKLESGTELTNAGEGARFGLNDFSVAHYSGPCPPKGEAHRYRYRVTALDTMLNLSEGTPRSQIDEAIDGHILGEGVLSGHFGH